MQTSILNLLRKRRSIRQFKPQAVADETIEALVETAVRTPTSRGRNSWEFVIVKDRQLLQRLAMAKEHGSAFLSGAPLAIVIAADTRKSDVWIEDCAIAAFTLQLAAEEMGLGSCWVQIRQRKRADDLTSEDYLKDLLGLSAHHAVECIIGIGIPAEEKSGHAYANLPFQQVHIDTFGS
jgi:nitroreductase